MATPRSARRAADRAPRMAPWFALCAVVAVGAMAVHGLTYGLAAWTLDERRDVCIARQSLHLPAIDVRSQNGHLVRLFDGHGGHGAASGAYIVDFIYTRCATVCRALGAEFQQLSAQADADGMTGRISLVSLSFDPRDTAEDLLRYANTYRARAPGWLVAEAVVPEAMERLLMAADVIAIPDGLGGFEHNGGLHVVDAAGRVLAVFPLERFSDAYALARSHVEGARP